MADATTSSSGTAYFHVYWSWIGAGVGDRWVIIDSGNNFTKSGPATEFSCEVGPFPMISSSKYPVPLTIWVQKWHVNSDGSWSKTFSANGEPIYTNYPGPAALPDPVDLETNGPLGPDSQPTKYKVPSSNKDKQGRNTPIKDGDEGPIIPYLTPDGWKPFNASPNGIPGQKSRNNPFEEPTRDPGSYDYVSPEPGTPAWEEYNFNDLIEGYHTLCIRTTNAVGHVDSCIEVLIYHPMSVPYHYDFPPIPRPPLEPDAPAIGFKSPWIKAEAGGKYSALYSKCALLDYPTSVAALKTDPGVAEIDYQMLSAGQPFMLRLMGRNNQNMMGRNF